MRPRRPLLICGLLMLLLAPSGATPVPVAAVDLGCPPPSSPSPVASPLGATPPAAAFPEGETTITVFAAASLTDAFAAIADAVEAAHPEVSVTLETAGSQTLVTQLAAGAQADVLATADIETMRNAGQQGLIAAEPAIFTTNRLVIVTPPDNPAGIHGIQDLTRDDIRLVIAAAAVPAGHYAHEAICAWADGDDDALAAIGDNVVSEALDVRAVRTRVQLGEADAGIIYASDAVAAKLGGTPLNVIELPEGIPTGAVYPIAPAAGGNVDAARAFIHVVLDDTGQQILDQYGFGSTG